MARINALARENKKPRTARPRSRADMPHPVGRFVDPICARSRRLVAAGQLMRYRSGDAFSSFLPLLFPIGQTNPADFECGDGVSVFPSDRIHPVHTIGSNSDSGASFLELKPTNTSSASQQRLAAMSCLRCGPSMPYSTVGPHDACAIRGSVANLRKS